MPGSLTACPSVRPSVLPSMWRDSRPVVDYWIAVGCSVESSTSQPSSCDRERRFATVTSTTSQLLANDANVPYTVTVGRAEASSSSNNAGLSDLNPVRSLLALLRPLLRFRYAGARREWENNYYRCYRCYRYYRYYPLEIGSPLIRETKFHPHFHCQEILGDCECETD